MDTAKLTDDETSATVPDLPMHELLALQAVFRLGSVQSAADALHVTASGISHRIASLEDRIGSPLLQRRGRGVVLTEIAQSYVASIGPGLVAFEKATSALLQREHRVVRIATAAAIGVGWLLPRLQRFVSSEARVRFELLTVATADELTPDRWDILIHYGHSARHGVRRAVLFQDRLIQVGSRTESTTQGQPLRLTQLDLTASAAERRLKRGEHRAQLVFDDALAMLEAASAGAGLAWSTAAAAQPYLAQGRLVRASDEGRDGQQYMADLSEAGQLKPLAIACYEALLKDASSPAPRRH